MALNIPKPFKGILNAITSNNHQGSTTTQQVTHISANGIIQQGNMKEMLLIAHRSYINEGQKRTQEDPAKGLHYLLDLANSKGWPWNDLGLDLYNTVLESLDIALESDLQSKPLLEQLQYLFELSTKVEDKSEQAGLIEVAMRRFRHERTRKDVNLEGRLKFLSEFKKQVSLAIETALKDAGITEAQRKHYINISNDVDSESPFHQEQKQPNYV